MREGTCVGGPLDGESLTIRNDDGFLAVDKPLGLAWRYRVDAQDRFVLCTAADPSVIGEEGARSFDPKRAEDGLTDNDLDIISIADDEVVDDVAVAA